jgi:hypothetical protein
MCVCLFVCVCDLRGATQATIDASQAAATQIVAAQAAPEAQKETEKKMRKTKTKRERGRKSCC